MQFSIFTIAVLIGAVSAAAMPDANPPAVDLTKRACNVDDYTKCLLSCPSGDSLALCSTGYVSGYWITWRVKGYVFEPSDLKNCCNVTNYGRHSFLIARTMT
ncbi:hypothetical protein F53441_11482 [Fusarium austroafricanum]|uniref:Uncharacterized protein n=1 Tax=Fusarium austroafricanum TaxID=2364996 RepID=A0A8H4K5I3_9HYPO|nr:hypothetical protein F53441_11482 [Fusarium austroafricanum]